MRLAIIALAAAVAAGLATPVLAQDVDVMQYADTNADGKLTPTEYDAFAVTSWDYLAQGADKAKAADIDPSARGAFASLKPDADGFVTKAAYLAAAPARFKAADKNGDGALDSTELNASMRPAG